MTIHQSKRTFTAHLNFLKKKLIFAGTFFFLTITNGFSQNLKFDHLSVKQGLSQGNVIDIMQDHLGFIWVATEDGLDFFDGYNFTVFRNNPADPNTISGNNTDTFVEDKKGNLWIATRNGLNYYDRARNSFEHYFSNPDPNDNTSLASNTVSYVYIDSNDNLWVGTTGGLHLFNSATKKFKRINHDPANPKSIASDVIETILEDSSHRLWFGTRGGLSMMNSDSATFTNYTSDPNDNTTLSTDIIISLYEDRAHTLWVGTYDGGLNKMVGQKFVQYKYDQNDPKTIGGNYVYHMSEDKSGAMWVAADGALNKMDREHGTFTRYAPIAGDESSLSNSCVTKVYFDVNDIMWVGTRFGGLNIYDKGKYIFKHFRYTSWDPNCVNANNITAFAEHKEGSFWICTDGGGLNYYDHKTGKFSNYYNLCTNNKTLAVAQDKDGGLWLGMWAGGVNYFNPTTKKIRRYLHDPNNPKSLADNSIFDIMIDHAGTVWFATFQGDVCKYNSATDDFTAYHNDPNNPGSFAGSAVVTLIEDSFHKIWIGTEQQGLDMYDPETGIFTHYKAGSQPGELSGKNVYAIFEDSKKRVWVGTSDAGLNLFDRETKKFQTFRSKDGLPNDAIQCIEEDPNGDIWISTNKGLSRLNPGTMKFKNFSESDGLQGDQFNRWSSLRLSTGELLFGGTNGFNMFSVNDVQENKYIPPVYITDFKLFNKAVPIGDKEVLKKNIMLSQEITLNYEQNIFSFDFTALNFRKAEKNRYKYIMEGFSDEWIDAGAERKASYTNLSPGEYTFRVKASNNDGIWNEKGVALKITIIPPFWRTWWFITLVILSIIFGIVAYFRYQKMKAIRQQRELESIIEERTREISAQSEEIIRKSEQEKIYNWITQGLALVSETISKNNKSLEQLGNETLKCVVKYAQAQQGVLAVAVKDEGEDEHLKILATYGVSKTHWKTDRIEIGSGMLGETYKDKQKRVLENLPQGYIKIESGLGEAAPARIVLLPLKTDDGDMMGVMELAFLGDATDVVQQFLDKVSSLIALNLFASSMTHKTMLLLQQQKEQTEELRAQEEEMRQNMEELEATSEEFRRRETEYQRKIEELERNR
jgi:ligand-binding sensor domain-containing protein